MRNSSKGEEKQKYKVTQTQQSPLKCKEKLKSSSFKHKKQANGRRNEWILTTNELRKLRLKQEKNKICNFLHSNSQNRKPHGKLQERVFIHENLEEK